MNPCIKFEDSDENFIVSMIDSEALTLFQGHIYLSKYSDKTQKMKKITKYLSL